MPLGRLPAPHGIFHRVLSLVPWPTNYRRAIFLKNLTAICLPAKNINNYFKNFLELAKSIKSSASSINFDEQVF